jgi:hypothetical protein
MQCKWVTQSMKNSKPSDFFTFQTEGNSAPEGAPNEATSSEASKAKSSKRKDGWGSESFEKNCNQMLMCSLTLFHCNTKQNGAVRV